MRCVKLANTKGQTDKQAVLGKLLKACAPVNQSFQMPDAMSLVDTTWAVTKSFSVLYTSMPLWLCTKTMLRKKPQIIWVINTNSSPLAKGR